MDNSACPQGCDSDQGDVVNYVALVISLVALAGTIAQVLQQYIASAAGYANCGESVMGKWHESKRRIFRPTELRFEVQFETPVIFVCMPSIVKEGPIKNKPIYFVDGTNKSLEDTRALLREEEEKKQLSLQERGIHTADNEKASWVTLLSEMQTMERESQDWQQQHFKSNPPPPPQASPLAGFDSHTLVVAVQAKQRSWDTMPAGVKKPYATTTMSHLLDIAAMMGIYWKEFDRSKERYRAEGNGCMLTGAPVPDLGLTFTFQIFGKRKFRDNRVIPVDEVKDLCCGFVPTLFQDENMDRRRIDFPNEEPKDLSILQFGSMDEIAETMVLIDCNTDTANYFRSDDTKHGHLFPVPFELIGMLGKTLHIRNSAFRMLPNPTPYHWDKTFFNLRRLMREYSKKVADSDADLHQTAQIQQLIEDASDLVRTLAQDKASAMPGFSMPLLNRLHDVLDRCDEFLVSSNRDLVRMVVREHFQEVLKLINERSGGEGDDGGRGEPGTGGARRRGRAERFEELTAASPEVRQEAFMELYFFKVLPSVRQRAVSSFERRQTTQYAPSPARSASPPASRSASPSASPPRPISPGPTARGGHEKSQSVPVVHIQPPGHLASQHHLGVDVTTSLESEASTIWCTLVLRMLCWLLLHDFNKKDVQIPKSELRGSRLPVYIA
ncbi:hypothetical protein VTK56DRAFT_856 [Thermocarpiscus australiensis]